MLSCKANKPGLCRVRVQFLRICLCQLNYMECEETSGKELETLGLARLRISCYILEVVIQLRPEEGLESLCVILSGEEFVDNMR